MSAEVTDVSSIQDEDLLRRMWQQTEDFGRKKEIRARMYKLREQRLKEFYTTGEVLSDVLSTSTSSLDEGRRNVNSSNLKSSQSSSQIISKSSSYTSSSSGAGYNITHADSLADEGFLALKTKEIRDSESPTREFHQRQEKNSKNESSSTSAGDGGSYWRIVQESSSGNYESTGTGGEGGDVTIHSTSRNEIRNLAGDSTQEGFTTSTQVSSSEQTLHKPHPGSSIELDVTAHKSAISTSNMQDTSASKVTSTAGAFSSSSLASCSASRSQQYQHNEATSAVITSTATSQETSQAVSGLEDTRVNVSESTKFSSSTSANQDIARSSSTATMQVNTNQTGKHRITQRSQTGELISKNTQSNSSTSDTKHSAVNQSLDSVTATSVSVTKDGSISNTKTAEQCITSDLHKVDSLLPTQNVVNTIPTHLGDTRDSNNWTVVSSDSSQNVTSATDEFIFCSGHASEDKKDSTSQHDTKFIEHERASSITDRHDVREPVDATQMKADEKTPTTTKKEKVDLQNVVSETGEIPKGGVLTQDKTTWKDGPNTTGQYVTTYQEAYTNKRISVDHSPTHEAFARSLRASPERATPSSSTRSSSKASLDRYSPDRFNKSPTRSYRNKTSLDNTLASGRGSPDKTTRSKTPPLRASPEKITNRASPRHSSPEKTLAHRSSPSRVSPEKTVKSPDGTSIRQSPEKITKSAYSPLRETHDKMGKLSATDTRKSVETVTVCPEKDGSPSLVSPKQNTIPVHAETTSSFKTYPEKLQQDKICNVPDRKVSSSDKPRGSINSYSPERKTSDSTKTYSSVSNTDSAVKSKTTKEKRKLSTGLSRAATKKRSSTPGVSPRTSPAHDVESRLTERQSRPRSRGTPSHSDSEYDDSDIKSKKLQHEVEIGDDISNTALHTATSATDTNIKLTEFQRNGTESYVAGEKIVKTLPSRDGEPREIFSEDGGLERGRAKSPELPTIDRARNKVANVTIVPRKDSPEHTANLKKIKHTDSASVTAKSTVNKSFERESYKPNKRTSSPQKLISDDVGTTLLLPSQKSSESSPSSSPSAVSPTNIVSAKSVLDRIPREKSPEYSSEGSIVNELYPKPSATDIPGEVTCSVKHQEDRKYSPDSSPDRGNFKPIKCFRTSPEIRPTTLDFAPPEKQSAFKASPEKIKSTTKTFKNRNFDDATINLESETDGTVNTLTELTMQREPLPSTNNDSKKSPERPNTSPAFENDNVITSTKIKNDIFKTEPITRKEIPPETMKGKICESEFKPDQNTEYPSTKKAADAQATIYKKDLGTITTNDTSENVPSGHKCSEKLKEGTPEDNFEERKQFPDSVRKGLTQHNEVNKVIVRQSNEPKSSSISPRSSSPEKSPVTCTAKITVNLTSQHKKHSTQDRKAKPAGRDQSPSTVLQRSSQQYPSDSSPEREYLKARTSPTSGRTQKLNDTASSKQTFVSNSISDTSTAPDKSIRKKSDLSPPLCSQSPKNLKSEYLPSVENQTTKVLESKGANQIPNRGKITAQTAKRPSRIASPAPHSSPGRISPTRTAGKKHDSSPDSRQSPTPSPNSLSDREIHSNIVEKNRERSPSSSPERYRTQGLEIKPSTNHVSEQQENYSPSPGTEKRSRIPSSCIRDHQNQSPARSSKKPTKFNQNMSRPHQSPVHPVQKTTSPNYFPARTKQAPARPSGTNTQINQPPTKISQSPKQHSSSPPGPKYETKKPKKSGSDAVPMKSAFVRTSSKPQDGTYLPRTKEPGHSTDQYPRQENLSKHLTRLYPSKKDYPVTKEPKHDKPGEIEAEESTDRSSTVSSPETVKTAGGGTAVDSSQVVSTKGTGQKLTVSSHKRTEMYIPQLTCDRDSFPTDDALGETPISLSALKGTTETKKDANVTSLTFSVTSGRKEKECLIEDKHHKMYYSQDYNVDDLRDETPPDEFLVEDDSPVDSLFQPYSTSGKPQKFPEDVGGAHQRSIVSKRKMTGSTSASTHDRTTTLTPKISKKSSTTNEFRRQKQELQFPEEEKTNSPQIQPKHRTRIATTADIRITRSSSDKNVTRKQTPSLASPAGVQVRRQTSKPEMTIQLTTIPRNASSTRQQKVTTVRTATAIHKTKIPTQSVKPTAQNIPYTTVQKRSREAPKPAVTTVARNQTFFKNQNVEIRCTKQTKKKLANGISERPHTSSSEDEQEVEEMIIDDEKEPAFTDVDDELEETYIRELDEVRRTDEELYASKLTAGRTLEDSLLSPSHDIPGVIIQPLKSSRESSPECPRGQIIKPRYADRISEPEDDDEVPRQYKQGTVFQKPPFLPEAVDEECAEDYSKPKSKELVETFQQNEAPDYVTTHHEQVTDLDEDSETDQAAKSVSVADRVSHFLETTRNALNSVVPSESGKEAESRPKPLDSPSTVRRARAMFETIANSQISTHKDFTKLKDTSNIFEAHYDSHKDSLTPGSRKPENQRHPINRQHLPDSHDILSATPSTKYSVDKSPHKADKQVKEFSQQEPLTNKYSMWNPQYDDSSEQKESLLAESDLIIKKGQSEDYPEKPSDQRTDSKQESSFPSRDEPISKKVQPQDIQPRKQSVRQDFPEDSLIQKFTKDTITQMEIMRQKDIVNRPSVFEARRLEQKSAPKQQGEFQHPYISKTSGYPEIYPSETDVLETVDVKYTADSPTKKVETGIYPTQDRSESKHTHYNVSSIGKESTSIEQLSTDTSPERILSRDDSSNNIKESTKRKDYPIRQESQRSSGRDIPKWNDSYPKREKSPSPTSRFLKKEQAENVSSRKTTSPGSGFTPQDSSPTRHFSRTKDTSTEKSPFRNNSSVKDTSSTCKVPYSRGESPTRNYSSPKDPVPTGNEHSPGHSSSTPKYSSQKDTSPTRKKSYPEVESPRESSPTRHYPTPKDILPSTKDSYPKEKSPRDSAPPKKYSAPEDISPKEPYPEAISPRDSSPTRKQPSSKDTSPTRSDSYPKVESPKVSSPTRKYPSSKDASPTRSDSHPKVESPIVSSPTRKHTSPKDTSPTRSDLNSKKDSPRVSSPTRKHTSSKDTSPTRKESYPKMESPRDSSPASKHSSSKDTSPTRNDSYSSRVTCNISSATIKHSPSQDESPRRKVSPPVHKTPRGISPTRQYPVATDTSLAIDESKQTLKGKVADDRFHSNDPTIIQETSPKRTSLTGAETRSVTPRKDSQSNQYQPKEEPKPQDSGTLRSSGRFGVNLRRTGSNIGSTIQRRLSGEAPKPVTTLNKKGDEPRIEDIFDLELLESMLEKAVGYEQRRSIRAQIRIVRRLLAERSAVTAKAGGRPEHPSDGDIAHFAGDDQDRNINSNTDVVVERKSSPTRRDDDNDRCQKTSGLPRKPRPETRDESMSPHAQDSKVPASRPEAVPKDSKPAPEKIPDWKSSPARKSSKSELNIELKPATPSSVKSPVKKSSLGEPPREAFPTDSVTSSYGVGPTDENGRPLFGLSALRRRQSTNNNIQISQDGVDNVLGSELEPEDKSQEVERKPSEICDSSGLPIFGGLRALKALTPTAGSKGDKAPSTENDNMREQRISSHLRELVTKHEQTSRGNAISHPSAPRQKPRAKLRDSFIQRSQDSEPEKRSAEELTDARVISQRVNSLRTLIQKHENIAQDDTRSDRVPCIDGDVPESGYSETCLPGILKKPHGSDQVITESTSTSSRTVISSRGVMKSDGTVSLKRDIIQGETVSRLGEEPVTRITRTQYTYNTPDDKNAAVLPYDSDLSNTTRKSSTSSRRSSSGKTPSPERGPPEGDVKLSRITTSSVTSSNSFRRSKISDDDRSKRDKISSTATHDSVSRRPQVTTDRRVEDDEKFVSLATAFLSQQKTTDENSGIMSRSSLERENIANTESEAKRSTLRDGKYMSSTTTTVTRTTPVSLHDDFEDTRKTASGYGKYSSTTFSRSETGREDVSCFLDSERSRCSSESRRLLPSNDEEENDGYQYIPRTVPESDTLRSLRRYSDDADTDRQVQRSEVCYSSSGSVSHTHSGATVTVETTTSSRSSTPKQISESIRRRSSAASDVDRDASPIPSSGFSRIVRGGSVRALSQKFQQAAGSANAKQSASVDEPSESTPSSRLGTPSAGTEGKSFLTNQTRVTGVQDVITRMKNADKDVKVGDSDEDAEARSLLNKFLGAQVMLQGMEPLVKASQSHSAALVSQVERQRVLASQKATTALTSSIDLEQDLEEIWDEELLRELLDKCSDYEGRRKIRARLRVVMAEHKACANVVAAALADEEAAIEREQEETGDVLRHSIEEGHSESKVTSSSTDGSTVTRTEVTTKTSSISATSVGKGRVPKAPSGKAMSPFAKFQQLDRQSSSQSTPSSPKTPGGTTAAPLFKFTDPKLSRSASGVKDRLLFWCQCKTKEYKNIQIDNFSTSWSNGLAFCALIHHFLPDAFEYDSLRPEERRKNFELAFRVADEKAGIAPLLDVEDMVIMHKPDWKCVFTYVQSVYRRFKDQD